MTTPTHNITPMRQRLGKSTLFHGLFGALIVIPVTDGSFIFAYFIWNLIADLYGNAISSVFGRLEELTRIPVGIPAWFMYFISLGFLPAFVLSMVYLLRQRLLTGEPITKAFLIYAFIGLLAPVPCFLLVWGVSSVALSLRLNIDVQNMVLLVFGFIAGVLCIQIEKRLNKTS